MALVHIPPQMRDLTDGLVDVEVEGRTVRRVLEALEREYPGFWERLVRDDRLAPGMAISVDHVVTPLGLRAPVGEASVMHIVPAIAGG